MSMVELRRVQQTTPYIADPEILSRIQLKRLLPVVLTILQKSKEEQVNELPRWEATLVTIQSQLKARQNQSPKFQTSSAEDSTKIAEYSLGQLNEEFERICNGSEEGSGLTSHESSSQYSSSSPLSKKEINCLIMTADRLASHYQKREDHLSRQEYHKWKSVSVEARRLQKENGQWGTAAARPLTSFFETIKGSSVSELTERGNSLVQRLPDEQRVILYMQNKASQLPLSSREVERVNSFIVRVEQSQSPEFIMVELTNGKMALIGRSADNQWFISEQNEKVDLKMKELFDESLASDDVLCPLFQYISFREGDSSDPLDYLGRGTSANVFLLDVQSYSLENVLNPQSESSRQRIAVKVFAAGWLEENGEQAILREWEDMQQVKDKASNTMQGHGTLVDSSGAMRAIVLPFFRGEMGAYIKACQKQDLYESTLPFLVSIARSFQEMHEADFCHNDIKLSNILVHYEEVGGKIVFTDFAIADLQNISIRESEDIKPTGEYCFREELEAVNDRSIVSSGKDRLDLRKRMDVRALGVTLYKVFAGDENMTPYSLEADPGLINQCMDSSEDYQPLPLEVPESIRFLVQRMLSKDSENVPTMREVCAILTNIDVSKIQGEIVRKKEILKNLGL